MDRIKANALLYLGSAVTAIAFGITANLLTPFLPPIASAVGQYIAKNLLPWIIAFFLLCIVIILLISRWQSKNRMNGQLQLADSMLSLLPYIFDAQDLDTDLHRLAKDLLHTAAKKLPFDPRRAVLFLPDEREEYLFIFEQFGQFDERYRGQEKFYIGPDDARERQRGMAGRAFKTQQPCIGHFKTERDRIQAMENGFIFLPHEEHENALSHPPYNSLICLPVRGTQGSLGVISFDSSKAYAFNSQDVREVLNILAKYTATALVIKSELQRLQSELQRLQEALQQAQHA